MSTNSWMVLAWIAVAIVGLAIGVGCLAATRRRLASRPAAAPARSVAWTYSSPSPVADEVSLGAR